jgi:KinB signaling pathway activation protein
MNQRIFWHIAGRTIAIGIIAGLFFALTGWPAKMMWYRGIFVGGFVSVAISLMGFWAFLTLNFIVRSFLPLRVWIWFQGLLTLLALVDVVYYFPQLIADLPTGLALPPGNYLWFIFGPFGLSIIVALAKARVAGKAAFVPGLFFMYVFTGVEWLPAVFDSHQWSVAGLVWMVLFLCNTYLLLVLGKMTQKNPAYANA